MASSVGDIEESVSRLSLEEARMRSEQCGDDQTEPSKQRVVVAAMDFGTTFSSFAHKMSEPMDSSLSDTTRTVAQHWGSSATNLVSQKTPTTLLLDPDRNFVAFGYDAEKEYADLANDGKHEGYRYFRHFKMMLFNTKELKLDTTLQDSQGQEMPAIDVIAHSIRFLKQKLTEALDRTGYTIHNDEIQWVLTIPAIWDPKAKQFMRKAAEKAGIDKQQLEFALEPEAASVYVKESKVEKQELEGDKIALAPFHPGTKYMVLDLGGGTVDITVKEVQEDRRLRELHKATGNDFGGHSINVNIMKFVQNMVGEDIMEEFFRELEYSTAVLDLEMDIEKKKRSVQDNSKATLTLMIPAVLLELFEKRKGKSLEEHVKSQFPNLKLKRERLTVPRDLVATFFKPSLDSILKLTNDVLKQESSQGVKDIIMVGGYSSCELIQKSIKQAYKGKVRVVVPPDPELAVLRGAVIYRYWPEVVVSRVCPYTYGSRFMRFFLEGFDDLSKKSKVGKDTYAKDVFNSFAKVGQEFRTGETATIEVFALKADTTKMPVQIYKSTIEEPKYCTDPSCSYLGELVVNMPDTTGGTERCVHVSLTLGHTEIIVTGQHVPNGEKATVTLDMLC